jgi:hypothetical protein
MYLEDGLACPGVCVSQVEDRWCDSDGRAIAQAASRRLPTSSARLRDEVMWDLWLTKGHCDRFSQSTSVSPANHSTDCSTFVIIHQPGLVQ